MRTLRPTLLALAALAACHDFSIPSSYVQVTVTPPVARQGTALTVLVSGSAVGATVPEVRLLGQLLPKSDSPGPNGALSYTYLATGREPEGVDLAVDVTAGAAQQSAKVRFDFTPPGIVSVKSFPASARPGTKVLVELLATEPLAAAPSLNVQGRDLACAAASSEARLFDCDLTPEVGDAPGWQVGAVALEDVAGNQTSLAALGLGLVFDFGQALDVAGATVVPSPAGRGATVDIAFATTQPLDAPPSVTVGAREATFVSGPGGDGRWAFRYVVLGTEIGGEPRKAVNVAAQVLFKGSPATLALPALVLDFSGPTVVSMKADRQQVGTVASGKNQVSVTFVADEPLSGLSAYVQARAMDCEAGADPTTWSCGYTADGTEQEGAQKLALWMADEVGNAVRLTTDDAFAFVFHCEIDAAKLFAVFRAGGWSFMADAGATEPGSALTITWGASALAVTSAADGSVPEQPNLSADPKSVTVQAVDAAGNACAPVQAHQRAFASPSKGWSWVGGTPTPQLSELTSVLTATDIANLAQADAKAVSARAQGFGPVDWQQPATVTGTAPDFSTGKPLLYLPRVGCIHLENNGAAGVDTFVWTGTEWLRGNPPFEDTDAPDLYMGFTMAVDPLTNLFTLFGGFGKYTGIDGTTWVGWFEGSPPDPFALQMNDPSVVAVPGPRFYPGMAFDRADRRTVLFGGVGETVASVQVLLDDSWIWDGAAWTQQAPITTPPARFGAALTYDERRARAVMFGGFTAAALGSCTGPACQLGDTWEWTGLDWVPRDVHGGPSARGQHSAAYHPILGGVVLFGGADDATFFDDTWLLDQSGWRKLETAHHPPARSLGGLTFDEQRGRLVLFGGADATTFDEYGLGDLWELTEAGLFPAVATVLTVRDAGALPSALRVNVVATAQAQAQAAGGTLTLSAWDYTLPGWIALATSATSGSVSATIVGRDIFRFLPGQTMRVLVSGPASATVAPPADPSTVASELDVDQVEVRVDW